MKTLVSSIQKGGQGKTMVACHLAFDFAERGLRVLVIDLDTQSNASLTLAKHQSGYLASQLFVDYPEGIDAFFSKRDNSGITLIPADAKLADIDEKPLSTVAAALGENVRALGKYFDVCIIDTAPSMGSAMTAAILAADFMLSPVEMEAYSLQGMGLMVKLITNLRKINRKIVFLGMLPNKVHGRNQRHKDNLQRLRDAYPQLVLPFSIGARDSIAEALGECIPVWKVKKTAARKATEEIRAVADHVFQKMELQ